MMELTKSAEQALLDRYSKPLEPKTLPPKSETPADEPAPPAKHLDITSPLKWQMALRVYLEGATGPIADAWMDEFRVIYAVAAKVVRDRVQRFTTSKCYVCSRPFPDGKPAGEAQYLDLDRNYIKVYCCHPNEYPQLLQKTTAKENEIRNLEAKAEAHARKALIAARQSQR